MAAGVMVCIVCVFQRDIIAIAARLRRVCGAFAARLRRVCGAFAALSLCPLHMMLIYFVTESQYQKSNVCTHSP
jgi:hypothetical protein